jgi:hypothetical protein
VGIQEQNAGHGDEIFGGTVGKKNMIQDSSLFRGAAGNRYRKRPPKFRWDDRRRKGKNLPVFSIENVEYGHRVL